MTFLLIPSEQVVLAEKPNISDDTFSLDPTVLDELISHLSSLAAIYHKPPSTFISGKRLVPSLGQGTRDEVEEDEDGSHMTSDMMGDDVGGIQAAPPAPPPPAAIDLLGGLMDDDPPPPAAGGMGGAPPPGMAGIGGLDDIFGMGAPAAPAAPSVQDKIVACNPPIDGVQLRCAFVKEGAGVAMRLTVENQGMMPVGDFAIQFNKNSFGLQPESPGALASVLPQAVQPGQSATGVLPLLTNGQLSDSKGVVQMAIKTSIKVSYFSETADVLLFLTADGRMDQQAFLAQWKGTQQEHRVQVVGIPPQSEVVEQLCPRLEASMVYFVARRKLPDADMVYLSVKTSNGIAMLAEVGLKPGSGACSIVVKAQQPQYVPLLAASLDKLLKA